MRVSMTMKQEIIPVLATLPYAREMQDYLINLTAALTQKLKPSADLVHDLGRSSQIFVCEDDIKKVLFAIQRTFETEGFMPPWELENKLIRAYHPRITDQAIQQADYYSAAEMEPDHLTGYMHKTQVPLSMGFSALYSQITGKHVTCFEIDYSNMRGTNDHFARVLSSAEQKKMKGDIITDAMTMTDQSAFIVASIIKSEIVTALAKMPAQHKRDQPQIIALRTGGDEIRIVAINLSNDMAKRILPRIHESIEYATAVLGLHDHSHSKRPLDPWSRGFGACATTFVLGTSANYKDVITKADKEIQNAKIATGQKRTNHPDFDRVKPEFSGDNGIYNDPAKAQAWLGQSMHVMAALRDDQQEPDPHADERHIPTLEDIAAESKTGRFLSLREIQTYFHKHLINGLEKIGITLTESEVRALYIKSTKFPSVDYATGTLMARDLPAVAGAALVTMDQINKHHGVEADPWIIGVSFHNLSGLNETLGHENANIILHHIVHQVMMPEFERIGVAKDNMVIAHMGGGEFRIIIQPVIPEADGTLRMIDAKAISQLYRNIQPRQSLSDTFDQKAAERTRLETRTGLEPRIDALNATPIADILKRYNQPCPAHLREYTIGDIENPREELQPFENGVTMTFAAQRYQPNINLNTRNDRKGGAIAAAIGIMLQDEIQDRRQSMTNDKLANEGSQFAPLVRVSEFDRDLF